MFLGAFALLVFAQGLQIYELAINQRLGLNPRLIYSIAFMLLMVGLFLVFSKSLKEIGQNKKRSEREEWLKKVYENIPAEVFLLKRMMKLFTVMFSLPPSKSFTSKTIHSLIAIKINKMFG